MSLDCNCAAVIWEMQNYLDVNDCCHMISFEFESLLHNFYSTAKLVLLCGPIIIETTFPLSYNPF